MSEIGRDVTRRHRRAVTIPDAEELGDHIVPFLAERGIGPPRVPTDRETEYCGKVRNHARQPYLAVDKTIEAPDPSDGAQHGLGIQNRDGRRIKSEVLHVKRRRCTRDAPFYTGVGVSVTVRVIRSA